MSMWTCHPLSGSLGAHAAAWDALNVGRFQSHPLLTSHFVNLLLRHFSRGSELLCIQRSVSDNAVSAMCVLQPSRFGVWCSFLPAQAQISPSLLRGPLDLPALLRALPGMAMRLDLLCLDPLFTDLTQQADPLLEHSLHALTMAVDLGTSYAAWWAARPKKLRDNMNRYLRRAADEGLPPRFLTIQAPEQVALAVRRYSQLEASGWKGREGTAVAAGSSQLDFYLAVMCELAERGHARVHEMWLGDTLVASRLTLIPNGMVVALKTAYDEAFKRFSPGRLLMHEVIRDAIHSNPGQRMEFYTNASSDQLAWASSQRQILHVTAYRNAAALWMEGRWRRWRAVQNTMRPAAANVAVETYSRVADIPDDARSLFARAELERVGNGLAWYDNLVKTALPTGADTRFLVLRRAGHAVAALPVLVDHTAAAKVQSLGNDCTTLFTPALAPGASATVLVPLLRQLRRLRGGLQQLRFAPMAPDSPGYAALRASLRACGLPTFEFFCHGNWYLPVTCDWPSYLAQRDGQLRTNIARGEKRLASRQASIEIITGGDALEAGIAAYQQVYAASWKKPEPHPDFIPELIRVCSVRRWLRLGVVRVDGQAIAAQVWIVANGRAEIYKLAYDETHKALGAGTALTARMFEHAITVDRVTEIDYLIGDDSYRAAWMSHRRERWGLVAYDRRTLGGCLAWLRELAGRAHKALGRRWAAMPIAAPRRCQRIDSD